MGLFERQTSYVLYRHFPDRKTELKYDLRQRRHEYTLTQKLDSRL